MKLTNLIMVLVTLGLAPIAFTADKMRTQMAIAVVDGDDGGETRIELDSDELGFDLHDMQIGENRSIVDETGRTILLTREEDGFRFDVDGKTIRMPAFHGSPHGPGRHHGPIVIRGDGHEEVDVHIVREAAARPLHDIDDILIVSGKPIDEATQQAIRSVLESAGHDSDVRFIGHAGRHGGPHRLKIVQKRTESPE